MNQNTQPTPPVSPQQPAQKVSFWKSKDPTTVTIRIVLYIFVGIPLLAILLLIIMMILSALKK